jgi:hypothetical protein
VWELSGLNPKGFEKKVEELIGFGNWIPVPHSFFNQKHGGHWSITWIEVLLFLCRISSFSGLDHVQIQMGVLNHFSTLGKSNNSQDELLTEPNLILNTMTQAGTDNKSAAISEKVMLN